MRTSTDPPIGEYSFYDPKRGQIIHGNPATSYGPYANDHMDESKANCQITWRPSHNEYWLQAQGPIAARTEILTMYGHEFWEKRKLLSEAIITRAYPQHLRRPQATARKEKC